MNPLACPECGVVLPLTTHDEDRIVTVLLQTGVVSLIDVLQVQGQRRIAAFEASGLDVQNFMRREAGLDPLPAPIPCSPDCPHCAEEAAGGFGIGDITIHRSELVPGGMGARFGYSDDFPDRVFLIIPERD